MRRSLKILVVMAVLMLATVGLTSIAGADETLADGTYSLTVPGIGMLTLNVAGNTVTVSEPSAAFNGQTATMTEDSEFVLTSASLTVKFEADDGGLTAEYRVDLGTLLPGDNSVTVGNLTFTLTLNDGSLSASGLPPGYTAMTTEDGLKIVTPDGTIKIKADDGSFTASVESASPDDSKDEYTNDDSKDEEVSSDSEDSDEVSSEDHQSDQTSTTDSHDSEHSGSDEGSHDGGDH